MNIHNLIIFAKTHRYKICLIAILIIAIFFRFYKITVMPPGLYPDEAMNGNNALEALATNDMKIFYPENNGREGLFINIQAFSVAFWGNEPWALRSISAFFGILTVLGLYLLAKELFTRFQISKLQSSITEQIPDSKFQIPNSATIIALLSSFFIATSFWHVNFSRIGFRAITVPFLTTFSFYFLFRGFRRKKILDFILSGIFMGLGFHTYIAFRIVPFVVIAVLIFKLIEIIRSAELGSRKEDIKTFFSQVIIYGIFALLAALPIFYYFYVHPEDFVGRAGQVSIFASENPIRELTKSAFLTMAQFNLVGDHNWRHNFSGAPLLFWPVGIFFLVGIFSSLKKCVKFAYQFIYKLAHNPLPIEHAFLLIWFAGMLTPSILSTEGLPHALRSIGAIPPSFIFAGIGAFSIYNFSEKRIFRYSTNKKIAFTIYAIILVAIAVFGFKRYFIDYANSPDIKGAFSDNFVKIGRFVNTLPKEMNKYIVVNAGGTLVNGIPMSTQTTMFITNSFRQADQLDKKIYYILPTEVEKIDFDSAPTYMIMPLERDERLLRQLKIYAPGELVNEDNFSYIINK